MTANYQENSIDTDFTYISANDTNYSVISSFNIPTRKTVVFGQNALTNTYPVGNFGDNYIPQYHTVPKIDNDSPRVIGATKDAVYYKDNNDVTYVRATFSSLENFPQTGAWLNISNTNNAIFYPIPSTSKYIWNSLDYPAEMGLLIRSDNTLWVTGRNSSGLGNNSTTQQSSPVQIGTSSNWTKISSGIDAGYAIQSNGTLWAWGNNSFGRLGLSDITNRLTPVQVGSLSDWSQISGAVSSFAAGIKTDGTLWTWGNNSFGQLGLSNLTHRSSPVQVGTLSNWSQVACGGGHMMAIKTDGTLWAWGYNNWGQLGLSNTTNRSSPVQVGTLSNWSKVSVWRGSFQSGQSQRSAAIKIDGTLWTWGHGGFGALAQSNALNYSTPTQVGSLTDWSQVTCGYRHIIMIKTDDTMWSAGYNDYGQLGVNTFEYYIYSPVQVSVGKWKTAIASASYSSYGLQTDGTYWAWGYNQAASLSLYDSGTQPIKQIFGL